ncbi:hypothetical protein GGX14DRAFT_573999 [Mycena pura]|uniref:Uncharacterized protein n=1 Tax=Mycena pura TaxID=153505 RepID=A0AAD6UZ57_9AGAR|nr:hypothetical protein GGX14DRAFT_573999 [Mycena pura]
MLPPSLAADNTCPLLRSRHSNLAGGAGSFMLASPTAAIRMALGCGEPSSEFSFQTAPRDRVDRQPLQDGNIRTDNLVSERSMARRSRRTSSCTRPAQQRAHERDGARDVDRGELQRERVDVRDDSPRTGILAWHIDRPLFQALRVWTEIGDICQGEGFEGNHKTIVEHRLNILVLPGIHRDRHYRAQPPGPTRRHLRRRLGHRRPCPRHRPITALPLAQVAFRKPVPAAASALDYWQWIPVHAGIEGSEAAGVRANIFSALASRIIPFKSAPLISFGTARLSRLIAVKSIRFVKDAGSLNTCSIRIFFKFLQHHPEHDPSSLSFTHPMPSLRLS